MCALVTGVHTCALPILATLETYLSEYFGQELKTKLQPFYFPFTEPSFEFAVERPDILKKNDSEEQKWLELGGCGMIHQNVLKHDGIDPGIYRSEERSVGKGCVSKCRLRRCPINT